VKANVICLQKGRSTEHVWVFDPDKTGAVKGRFTALLGPGAMARFDFIEMPFAEAIEVLKRTFPAARD
jgi:hypothetical protein